MSVNEGKNHQVLLVEDDAALRASMASVLEEDGFTVRTVSNGQQAMEALIRGERPRVIVLDLLMPVMDGWKFAAALQADARLASIPIVIASVAVDERISDLASSVLRKPFPSEHLLHAVRKLVEAPTPAKGVTAAKAASGFQPGPRLRDALERMREEERTGRRMGFWLAPNAAERLAIAIQADQGVEAFSEHGPAKGGFRFGPHARLELAMLHLDPNDADVLERAIQEDLTAPLARSPAA